MRDIALLRAPNPGPFTLAGTNSWLVGRDPTYLIDPGPSIDAHIDALDRAIAARGGLAAVLVTHNHTDHAGAAPTLAERHRVPVAGAGSGADWTLHDGDTVGPLSVHATPGHTREHTAFVAADVCFTGDAVLGEGSVFIDPAGGGLVAYLAGLERLGGLAIELGAPGHGPLILDVRGRLDDYAAHRLEREREVLAAIDAGASTREEILLAVWSQTPLALRGAAALTLEAHLDKLRAEGRLPPGLLAR